MFKLFIDPGHGGRDPGATANGLFERDINLTVSLYLEELLKRISDIDVRLSRKENDTYLTLKQRTSMANSWGADLLISIHHNAGGGQGFDLIHSVFTSESLSDEICSIIAEEFKLLGQTKHGIYSKWNSKKNENYYGIIRTAKMDSLITEYAFMDSIDFLEIDTVEEQKEEAVAIYNAIKRFCKLEEKQDVTDINMEKQLAYFQKRIVDPLVKRIEELEEINERQASLLRGKENG